MMKLQRIGLLAAVIALFTCSGAAVFAQTETATPVPPPVFTDGRINGSVNLGGLALYCVDSAGKNISSFDNGAITVWGVGDQKYINLDANQLRGNVEIPQLPSQAQMQAMTEEAMMATEDMGMMTETPVSSTLVMPEATLMPAATVPSGMTAVLLARAMTPNGEIGFFSLGNDAFALQGYDQNGKFFTYTWTGCSTGMLDNTTGPYQPGLVVQATPMMTPEMTMEATTSP
ncbi:MAG TPA: hypothetical protein VHD90_10450 [Phototrophicaceae bacterium]|nr:hypothetical protein [Phototrophicaceae bacterium]